MRKSLARRAHHALGPTRQPNEAIRRRLRSGPFAHRQQVLHLEPRPLLRSEVPLVTEPVQSLFELLFTAFAACVRLGGDRGAVPCLEMLGVVARLLERRDLEGVTLEGAPRR